MANNNEKREKGLMFTQPLKGGEVAFFVFPVCGNYSFWNKNVNYDIDLAFLNEAGKVICLRKLKANCLEPVSADSNNVKYVVEAKFGIFDELGINDDFFIDYDNNFIIFKRLLKDRTI